MDSIGATLEALRSPSCWMEWCINYGHTLTAHKRQETFGKVQDGFLTPGQQLLHNPHMLFDAILLDQVGIFAVFQATATFPRVLSLMHFAPKDMVAIHLGSVVAENCCIRWIQQHLPAGCLHHNSIVDVDACCHCASLDGGCVGSGTLRELLTQKAASSCGVDDTIATVQLMHGMTTIVEAARCASNAKLGTSGVCVAFGKVPYASPVVQLLNQILDVHEMAHPTSFVGCSLITGWYVQLVASKERCDAYATAMQQLRVGCLGLDATATVEWLAANTFSYFEELRQNDDLFLRYRLWMADHIDWMRLQCDTNTKAAMLVTMYLFQLVIGVVVAKSPNLEIY